MMWRWFVFFAQVQATKRADPGDLKTIFLKVRLMDDKTFAAHTESVCHKSTNQSVSSFCVPSTGMHSSIKVMQMLWLILVLLQQRIPVHFDFRCICDMSFFFTPCPKYFKKTSLLASVCPFVYPHRSCLECKLVPIWGTSHLMVPPHLLTLL